MSPLPFKYLSGLKRRAGIMVCTTETPVSGCTDETIPEGK